MSMLMMLCNECALGGFLHGLICDKCQRVETEAIVHRGTVPYSITRHRKDSMVDNMGSMALRRGT